METDTLYFWLNEQVFKWTGCACCKTLIAAPWHQRITQSFFLTEIVPSSYHNRQNPWLEKWWNSSQKLILQQHVSPVSACLPPQVAEQKLSLLEFAPEIWNVEAAASVVKLHLLSYHCITSARFSALQLQVQVKSILQFNQPQK